MRSIIFTSALMIGSCFATVTETYQEHNTHTYKRTDFKNVIDHYKGRALESALDAYKFIELISTGIGTVNGYSFNGVDNTLGTYEEHDKAFELLQEIGCKYGSGFYIPYGDNYDFVRTALNCGDLFGKGVESKITNPISNNKEADYDENDPLKVDPSIYDDKVFSIKKKYSEEKLKCFNDGQITALLQAINNANDVYHVLQNISEEQIKNAFTNATEVNVNNGSLRDDWLASRILREIPDAIGEEELKAAFTNATEVNVNNGSLRDDWLASRILREIPDAIGEEELKAAFTNATEVNVNNGSLRGDWLASRILEKRPNAIDKESLENVNESISQVADYDDLKELIRESLERKK